MSLDIMKESTQQEILSNMQLIAALTGSIAGATPGSVTVERWSDVGDIIATGLGKKIFAIGDKFTDTWKDTVDNRSYEFPWRCNCFRNVELEDGNTVPGMLLQMAYATPFGVQFSNARAFLRCPNGLAAGTYNVTFGDTWGSKDAKANTTWQFTLTKAVPAGGRLAGFIQMPDVAATSWKVIAYAADGITKLETVSVTSGSEGTALGTMNLSSRNGDLNSMQETGYGWNRWKTSAYRQYLNSDKPKGQWWTPQDEWDIAPDQLATKDGFLRGMPKELLDQIQPVKVITYTNTVNDGGNADVTYDKVFLPALGEMYYEPQIDGEGEPHDYWKERSGSATKLKQYTAYPNMITYAVENHTSAQNVRLRSANRGHAHYAWFVSSDGFAYSNYAFSAYRSSPLVAICRKSA